MTCSRCHLSGHNSRNRLCPALISDRPRTPQLRPRGYVAPRTARRSNTNTNRNSNRNTNRNPNTDTNTSRVNNIPDEDIFGLARMFQNIRSYGDYTFQGVRYKCYLLSRRLMENRLIHQTIVNIFIDRETQLITTHIVPGTFHVIAMAFVSGESSLSALHGMPYPTDNREVVLCIPQIPGVTSEEDHPDPIIKYMSNYVKDWEITLDLTCNKGDDADTECVICLDTKEKKHIVRTNCGHEYCIECVKNNIRVNKNKTVKPTCPMCRTELCEILVGDVDEHSELDEFIIAL